MHAALFNNKEVREIEFLIKRELEELLSDIKELPANPVIKRVMEERYDLLFDIFKRFAPGNECLKYMKPPY